MNYSLIGNILGKIMILLGILMILPLVVCIIYREAGVNYLAFLIPIAISIGLGALGNLKKAKSLKLLPRDGFVIVGLAWFVLALVGAMPLMISGEVPNFFDAFFEMSSGFTTTGATVVPNVEALSHSILMWRSFSHWIGGMGVLVFILALVPESEEGSSIHILRAESTGPQVGKLVSKMKASSRILYLIYMVMTAVQILLLWWGPDKKMGLFESMLYSFGTAGTGGFSMNNDGLASYAPYSQYVIAVFMILFGINFSLYYLILIGKAGEVFKNDELKSYLIVVFTAVALICVNLVATSEAAKGDFEWTFRNALFHIASLISTTGYSISNYDLWPSFAKTVLIFVMITGACAGSTAGGLKISRLNILVKGVFRDVRGMISPRKVETVRENGKPITDTMVHSVQTFFCTYIGVLLLCTLLIAWDDFASGADLTTHFTASLTCISNVGPGFAAVGPATTFAEYSGFSKLVLSIEMIAGRLELFPIILLLSPKTWRRVA